MYFFFLQPQKCDEINFSYSLKISSVEMGLVIQVQIPGKAVSISHSTNILGKGMNSTILPPSYG